MFIITIFRRISPLPKKPYLISIEDCPSYSLSTNSLPHIESRETLLDKPLTTYYVDSF